MRKYFLIVLLISSMISFSQSENKSGNITPTYEEIIMNYQQLDVRYSSASLMEMGLTDAGKPLYLFLMHNGLTKEGVTVENLIKDNVVILINNGIHPGEPCGIDASLKFAEDILKEGIPPNILIGIIPVYNIGGALNRNCCSRANQNGPEIYGFRGNARNLDLNRDFIKADARNTLAFYSVFHTLKPHIFVDTHTSNGADYQYTMSLISTQKDKLNPVLSTYLQNKLEPHLYNTMEKAGWEMIPYVNVFGGTPDKGYTAFLESPRYASGYTALFNTIGFITEAHMLKPYADRVEATLSFLKVISGFASLNAEEIKVNRDKAFQLDESMNEFPIDWKIDSTIYKNLKFKGFEYSYPLSSVSGQPRLKYHNDKPATYDIKFYDTYAENQKANAPQYYIIPAAWWEVPQLLQQNEVEMEELRNDTVIEVSSYYVSDFKFSDRPYEGHFPLISVEGKWRVQKRKFYKGDFLIPMEQKNKRFIISVLEPEAVDSYLRWNFYDEIFQQKEWFSSYVFEEEAEQLLKNNAVLRQNFENWKKKNPKEANDAFMNLYYIYRQSDAYEKEHLRYPVARIE